MRLCATLLLFKRYFTRNSELLSWPRIIKGRPFFMHEIFMSRFFMHETFVQVRTQTVESTSDCVEIKELWCTIEILISTSASAYRQSSNGT